MRKIRIAQIGTSLQSHGNMIWAALRDNPDVFEIVGYAMPENEKEKFPNRAKWYENYREMTVEEILNDPTIEAVTVETEELYLTKYALMAAKAGKHIHMEKPGGQNLKEFEELIRVLRQTGKVFHIGYMYRYNPFVRELFAEADRGGLGKIISVDGQMSCANAPDTRRFVGQFRGGMMFFLGCHLIDLVYRLQGAPEKVIPLNCSTGLDDVHTEDFGMAVLQYPGGVSTVKTTHVELGAFCRRHLVVAGTEKTVEIRPLESIVDHDQFTTRVVHTSPKIRDWGEKEESPFYDRYAPMLLSFAEMVRGEKENPNTLDYELGLYKLILQCCGVIGYESDPGE